MINRSLLAAFLLSLLAGFSAADDSLVDLLETVKPSVVTIETDVALGTGFIAGTNIVVTNQHVIDGASKATVKLEGGETVSALGILYVDKARDIAVLKTEAMRGSPRPLPILSGLPKQGHDVIALGNPRGFEFSVSRGIVSSVRSADSINDLIKSDELAGTWVQTDASISKGNSGGPLLNHGGEVVGMNTFSYRDGQNLNFAISSVDIRAALETAKIGKLTSFAEESPPTPAQKKAPEDFSFVTKAFENHAKQALAGLTSAELRSVKNGNLADLFTAVPVTSIKEGQLARVKGKAIVIQILKNGALIRIDGVKCLILFVDDKGAELRAKLGDEVISNVPVDALYYVGKSTAYETVGGSVSYYIPIIAVGDLPSEVWKPTLDGLLNDETARRTKAETARDAENAQRAVAKISRTFSDSSGRFTVDAAAIEVENGKVRFIRVSDGREIVVALSKLSAGDNKWIEDNSAWIRLYGPRVKAHLIRD